MNCIVYCRISKFDRPGEAPGVEDQTSDGLAEAARRGWTVVEVIKESDESAFEGNFRPGYARLNKLLEEGAAQAVVARDGTRLHRDLSEYLIFEKLARRKKLTTAFYKGSDFEVNSASGRMSARIINVVAQAYSETIQENVNRAMERRAREGLPANGSKRAYGYEEGNIQIRESEARIIRDGAADLLAGRTSLRALARTAGLTHRGLKGVLTAPRIAGFREYAGTLYPAVWPGIIDADTWATLRLVLNNPNPAKKGGRPSGTALLSGRARCGSCEGRTVVSKDRSGKYSYRCRNEGCERKITRQCDRVDAYVSKVVLEAMVELGERPVREQDDATVLAEIRKLELRLGEIAERMADPDFPMDVAVQAERKIKAKLAELEGQITQAAPPPPLEGEWPWGAAREEWDDWWGHPDRTMEDKRGLIDSQVAHVLLLPTRHGGLELDRASVQIVPR